MDTAGERPVSKKSVTRIWPCHHTKGEEYRRGNLKRGLPMQTRSVKVKCSEWLQTCSKSCFICRPRITDRDACSFPPIVHRTETDTRFSKQNTHAPVRVPLTLHAGQVARLLAHVAGTRCAKPAHHACPGSAVAPTRTGTRLSIASSATALCSTPKRWLGKSEAFSKAIC